MKVFIVWPLRGYGQNDSVIVAKDENDAKVIFTKGTEKPAGDVKEVDTNVRGIYYERQDNL